MKAEIEVKNAKKKMNPKKWFQTKNILVKNGFKRKMKKNKMGDSKTGKTAKCAAQLH